MELGSDGMNFATSSGLAGRSRITMDHSPNPTHAMNSVKGVAPTSSFPMLPPHAVSSVFVSEGSLWSVAETSDFTIGPARKIGFGVIPPTELYPSSHQKMMRARFPAMCARSVGTQPPSHASPLDTELLCMLWLSVGVNQMKFTPASNCWMTVFASPGIRLAARAGCCVIGG